MGERPVTRLLVVGGSGFVGRHIVSHAARIGWQVTSLSIRQANAPIPGVTYRAADVADQRQVKGALQDAAFEYVVNCAGYIDHASFFRGGRGLIAAHFDGVMNVVETVDREVLRTFINIGSSDEYGDATAPQAESLREAPISAYSVAKTAATQFLQMLHRTEGFPATTLRLFLTYGPGQDERRFVPQVIRGCLRDEPFPTSAGEQLRDFCFVGDTVEAIFATLGNPRARGEIINIGSGRAITIRQVVEAIRRLIGRGAPRFGEVAYRAGENMALYADTSKAEALLGWKSTTSLDAGLGQTIDWMKRGS